MPTPPVLLFGAFDRHNLGDLLLAEAAVTGLAGRPHVHAGLLARDMRPYGGPQVHALAEILARWPARYGDAPLELVHVGGEILTTTAWQALVMLQEPEAAWALIARHEREPGREDWAAARLGCGPLAYVWAASALPAPARTAFRAVGGVGFAELPETARAYALAALAGAERVSVRDRATRDALAGAGMPVALAPDPVEAWARLHESRLRAQARTGAVAGILEQTGGHYLAVQFAAEHGSDAELARIAARLDDFRTQAGDTGLPVVLFRAGTAPWHDDEAVYRRLMSRLRGPAFLFTELHIGQLCALIAASRALIATSLHARILARVFGVELLPLPEGLYSAKVRAYEGTWPAAPS